MFDLEKAIREWKKDFHKYPVFEDGIIADIELHLRDEFESQKKAGLDSEEAFRAAVTQVGTPETLSSEYNKNRQVKLNRRSPLRVSRFMPALIWNYIKTALRKIRRHKAYSFSNIIGLAIGMACCILIFFYVSNELSYDRYHNDSDRIYRVAQKITRGSVERDFARVAAPLIPAIRENFPEVEHAVRFQTFAWMQNLIKHNDKKFYEDRVMIAENDIFNVLSIPFIEGNPETALTRPKTVVISEHMAQKYFDVEDPLGKTLEMYGDNFEVTGIVANPPENTHIPYGFIVSILGWEKVWNFDNWGWTGFYAYVKLKSHVNPRAFEDKIRHIADKYISEELEESGVTVSFYLQPIQSIHLHSNLTTEIEAPGNPVYIYIFSVIGFLILFVSCVNFINLSTARSATRAKEVGIRKVVGAHRSQLAFQFLGETILMCGAALCIALVFVTQILPFFNNLSGKHFELEVLLKPVNIAVYLGLAAIVGIASGTYPAFLLSLFKPVRTLKGSFDPETKNVSLRKILVVSQFSITIFLIIATFIVFRQVSFMKNQYLGFEKEQKLIIPATFHNNQESIKAEFLRHPSIKGAAAIWSAPGRQTNLLEARLTGEVKENAQSMDFLYVDQDFIPEYKIKMAAGRNFQKEITTDTYDSFIINETASQAFGFKSAEEALGKQIYEGGSGNVAPIIGVTTDFHFKGLQTRVEPLVMQLRPDMFRYLSLTLNTDNFKDTLSFIEKRWDELQLGDVFSYFFLDEDFNRQYSSEEKIGQMFGAFTLIAIFISCLGLAGLVSFSAEQRTKEIGIRKVLGASVPNILVLLSKEFMILVLLSNLIAWPIAYFSMQKWLQNFAYQTHLGLGIFFSSGMLALGISLITVSYQSIKTATANPADSLQYE